MRIKQLFALAIGTALGLAFAAPAHAQFPHFAELSAQYSPSAALEDPQPAEVQVSSYDAALNLPIPLAEKSYLIPGLAYHVESVSFADAPPELDQLRAFHSADFNLLFVQLLPNDWSIAFRGSIGLAGDFQHVDSGLLRWSAMVMATKAINEKVTLGGAVLASWSFGSLLPLPAIYFDWQPNERWQLETFLPAFISFNYRHAGRLELGVRAEVQGNSYAVRDDRVRGAWPCRAHEDDDPTTPFDETLAQPEGCLDHIAYSVGMVGLHVGVRLLSSVWITAFGGYTVLRRYEPMNGDDVRIEGGQQTLPGGYVVRLALQWRLPTNQDAAPEQAQ